ncbi:MAG TPA: SGNH/GDSL hydrolase family protein [Vicinamibacterales bacterium]
MWRAQLRRRLVMALFFGGVAAGVELLSRAGLSMLERRGVEYRPILVDELSVAHSQALADLLAGRPSLFQHDAVLGWSLRPGFRSSLCTIDADGLRRDRERPPPVAPAVEVATYGDSFTFGGDVADRDAYPEALARQEPRIAVANYGVPAYGLDQAFLRYQRDGRGSHPQVVVIGFMSENIRRNVSVFRPFYQPVSLLPLAKPRYVPGEHEPYLLANPLPRLDDYRQLLAHPAETLSRLGQHDFFYRTRPRAGSFDSSAAVRLVKLASEQLGPGRASRFYAADSEAFRVTTELFTAFYELALRDGAQPVIVIFPERGDLAIWRSAGIKRYAPLLRFFAGKGYRVVDAMAALDAAGRDRPIADLVPSHYSPLANQLVAEQLLYQLRALGLVPKMR